MTTKTTLYHKPGDEADECDPSSSHPPDKNKDDLEGTMTENLIDDILVGDDDGLDSANKRGSPSTTIAVSERCLWTYYAFTQVFFALSLGIIYVAWNDGTMIFVVILWTLMYATIVAAFLQRAPVNNNLVVRDSKKEDIETFLQVISVHFFGVSFGGVLFGWIVSWTAISIATFATFLYVTIAAAHFQVQLDSNGFSIQAISSLRSGRMNFFVSWDDVAEIQLWGHCGLIYSTMGFQYATIKQIVLVLEQEEQGEEEIEIKVPTEFWNWKMATIQGDLERYLPNVTAVKGTMPPEHVRVLCFAHSVLGKNHPEVPPSPDSLLAHPPDDNSETTTTRTRPDIELRLERLCNQRAQWQTGIALCMMSIYTIGFLSIVVVAIYLIATKGPNGISTALFGFFLTLFAVYQLVDYINKYNAQQQESSEVSPSASRGDFLDTQRGEQGVPLEEWELEMQ
mmetsp:Transcript_39424/g.95388  ORF Transcript_39424/g.95388 Transcript_39424/m.95388 type:complete len:453 (+) Transcript_39424:116-1474(+)|eukprot:CAMPEP_0113630672 /NCGR_PEP_ID=MMETSP0017_2-20120614/15938_1 /TAXON_ID=2856 /ORGANISM="Cylindrotheca closterium" /LENGTH=452 /DNA_ID=CAMNT_0000541149 /DNA_START=23 /DNA_END=1384 /DNA_ORIENTATION=+ /assembly_acc=CAM_ASM_000147